MNYRELDAVPVNRRTNKCINYLTFKEIINDSRLTHSVKVFLLNRNTVVPNFRVDILSQKGSITFPYLSS